MARKSAGRVSTAILIALLLMVLAPGQAGAAKSTCGDRALSQPFLPWLDPGQYFLMPGGDLESGAGWTFSRGARITGGNEPFHVHSAADAHSLFLPPGATARSATTCVAFDEPTMRFFVRSTGSPVSLLAVEARIRTNVLGVTTETSLPLGAVLGTQQTWQPSLPVVFEFSANQVLGGTSTVDFRFRVLGLGGLWLVDDIYVDPFKDR